MAYNIQYRVHSNILNLVWTDRPAGTSNNAWLTQIMWAVYYGAMRFADFFDVTVQNTSAQNQGVLFVAVNGSDASWWARWNKSANAVEFNNRMPWSLYGLEIATSHELGHKYLTYYHLSQLGYSQPTPFPGASQCSYQHFMWVGAGCSYQGTFSPTEVWLGLKNGFRLRNNRVVHGVLIPGGVHPFCTVYHLGDANFKAANLAKLKFIVKAYGGYHAHLYAWQDDWAIPPDPNQGDGKPVEIDGVGLVGCDCGSD